MNDQDQIKSLEENIVNRVNSLKDDINKLKEIVIGNIQYGNKKLQCKCECLKSQCAI